MPLREGYDAFSYRYGREHRGTFMVVQGLHYEGPADPRMDRFCRVLARAGFWVVAPRVPDYLRLHVRPRVISDVELCLHHVTRQLPPHQRPTLFSISFGSWPVLSVAAEHPDLVDGVVTFGGYADFERTIRFCVEGVMRGPEGAPRELPRDPLNSPALFINLLPHLQADDPPRLEAAWREMVHRTWGRPEMKLPGRRDAIAADLAGSLTAADACLFRRGCGLEPGTLELLEEGLARARGGFSFASPVSALERIRCPVAIFHGRDDDVIPWGEAIGLQRHLEARTPVKLFLTGLFSHTESVASGAEGGAVGRAVEELGVLVGMARTLASGGQLRAFASRW